MDVLYIKMCYDLLRVRVHYSLLIKALRQYEKKKMAKKTERFVSATFLRIDVFFSRFISVYLFTAEHGRDDENA